MWSLENWAVDQSLPDGVSLIHAAPATASVDGPSVVRRYDAGQGSWLPGKVPAPVTPLPGLVFRAENGRCVSGSGVMLRGEVWPTGSAWHAAVDVEAHAAFHWPAFAEEPVATLESGAWIGQAGDAVFGHCLLDVLPRAVLLHEALDPSVPFVTSASTSPALEDLLEMAGVTGRPIVRIAASASTLVNELFLTTSARQGDSFDAARIDVFTRMRTNALHQGDYSQGELVHLSRGKLHRGAGDGPRELTNRAEVDATFAAAGYSIVSPEALTLAEQIQLIHHARAVSGEVGSAMHLVMFAAPGASMTVLRSPLNRYPLDPLCAGIGEAELNIIEGDPADASQVTEGRPARAPWIGSWRLDTSTLASALTQLPEISNERPSTAAKQQGESP